MHVNALLNSHPWSEKIDSFGNEVRNDIREIKDFGTHFSPCSKGNFWEILGISLTSSYFPDVAFQSILFLLVYMLCNLCNIFNFPFIKSLLNCQIWQWNNLTRKICPPVLGVTGTLSSWSVLCTEKNSWSNFTRLCRLNL